MLRKQTGRFLGLAASQYSLKTKSMCKDERAKQVAVLLPCLMARVQQRGPHSGRGEPKLSSDLCRQIHVCVHTNVLF